MGWVNFVTVWLTFWEEVLDDEAGGRVGEVGTKTTVRYLVKCVAIYLALISFSVYVSSGNAHVHALTVELKLIL